ncbi:hypothetical protein T484DRAFT_1621453, partial [Baffinella frigidus]
NERILTVLNARTLSQVFLRGHDDLINALALSKSGRYIASGQARVGDNADVIVWDFEAKRLLYRMQVLPNPTPYTLNPKPENSSCFHRYS